MITINTEVDALPFDPQWTLWQFIDSSFPSGAFMHSGGLEAAFRAELPAVKWTTDTLTHYLRLYVQQTAGALLPIVREAFVHGEDLNKYAELDLLTEQCTVSNHVTHRASTSMGMSLIITAVNCFPNNRLKEVKAFINTYEHPATEVSLVTKSVQGHFAPLFGLICKRLELEQDHVRIGQVFMYTSLRAVVSAAVRLNMIGPIEGQRIQASCYQLAQKIVIEHIDRPLEQLGQTCPLLDIIQGSHDTLYSRLFNT
jgi:urease accessory protein